MNVYITGGSGFIAKNLATVLKAEGHRVLQHGLDTDSSMLKHTLSSGEPCVYRNDRSSWEEFFKINDVNYVVHNAAVVGTDVVALNMQEATLTNVLGTENILRAAFNLDVPATFLGTTVVYKTQNRGVVIDELTTVAPQTYYGVTKAAGDLIAKRYGANIIRPLFAYGGLGDMNSMIVKVLHAACTGRKKPVDIFLDPRNVKDYIHVYDFCTAVAHVLNREVTSEDYIVAAETGQPISDVLVQVLQAARDRKLSDVKLQFHPETDYLKDHILTSHKFRTHFPSWKCTIPLIDGINRTANEVVNYFKLWDPMHHIDNANVNDITKNFK